MVTYEQIKAANEAIITTDIKGKDYAEVNQRIKAFKMVYPEGFIHTEILSLENGLCVMRSQVGYYTDDGNVMILGTGTAYEKEGSTFINKTSYIENCETSAVGRALGMAGFGIDTSVASYEEVANAVVQQADEKKIDKTAAAALQERCEKDGIDAAKLLGLYKVSSFNELTYKQLSNINQHWDKVKENCKE